MRPLVLPNPRRRGAATAGVKKYGGAAPNTPDPGKELSAVAHYQAHDVTPVMAVVGSGVPGVPVVAAVPVVPAVPALTLPPYSALRDIAAWCTTITQAPATIRNADPFYGRAVGQLYVDLAQTLHPKVA